MSKRTELEAQIALETRVIDQAVITRDQLQARLAALPKERPSVSVHKNDCGEYSFWGDPVGAALPAGKYILENPEREKAIKELVRAVKLFCYNSSDPYVAAKAVEAHDR
ncbi:MAG: hypothetical protein RJA98_687 [Pseudomonadota bacterium]|jgi:uncharacterized protein YbdZ (MbtH family)